MAAWGSRVVVSLSETCLSIPLLNMYVCSCVCGCSMPRCMGPRGCSNGIFCFLMKDRILLYSFFEDFSMLVLEMEIATYKKKTHCVLEKKFALLLSMQVWSSDFA